MTVGEAPLSNSASDLAKYVLPENRELNMVFQFELMTVDDATLEPLSWKKFAVPDLEKVITKWQTFDRDQGFCNAYAPDILSRSIVNLVQIACISKTTIILVQSRDTATIPQNGAHYRRKCSPSCRLRNLALSMFTRARKLP